MSEAFGRTIIDSRRLLYFYHVAKNGSLSRAEAALNAPQPVISRHINKLEEELGVQLLDRNGRGVTLTRFGEILYSRAETILGDMAAAVGELDLARRQPAGQVRIAAPATFMTLYMPEIVRRFMDELPDVELVAAQALTGEIYEKLVTDKVDIGIVLQVPNKAKFEVHELLVEPMVCIVARSHPLAAETFITREQLVEQRMVVPSSAHGLRELIDVYMGEGGYSINPHLQIDSVPLIREVVAQGQLATLLPHSTSWLEFDPKLFAAIKLDPPLRRSLYAAHLKDSRRGQFVDAMMRHIIAVFREHVAGLDSAAA
ncbi:LysR family transcriptional regulator [Sphingomonas sp. 1P06PA]|uniref:LysR family transcriptional regulator n=1 Tax=Sphingomonas sp. 1P06PA TaxID=554121 RepID=UPI0039A71854